MTHHKLVVCLSGNGDIHSFILQVASDSETVTLPKFGPGLSNCSSTSVSEYEHLIKVRIFRRSDNIIGFGLKYSQLGLGDTTLKIGNASNDYRDFDFGDDDRVMGFSGTASTDYVTSMGFVVESL